MKKSVWRYLLLIVFFWAFCFVTLKVWLLPYAVAYAATGKMTAGYFLYAVIGILFSTPAPFLSTLLLSLFYEKIPLKTFLSRLVKTEKKREAVCLSGGLCAFFLGYALLFGERNGAPFYMLPLGFLVMLPFVGYAEEAGWRGYLGPALEARLGFLPATFLTAGIWYVWHLDLWFDETSNHYGDSLVGFGITIFLWALSAAALYRVTKSVTACAVYHAFVDALGAVYDWNKLFDAFPAPPVTWLFRAVWLFSSVALLLYAKRKERQKTAAHP